MSSTRIYTPGASPAAEPNRSEEQADRLFEPGPFPVHSLNDTQRRIVETVAEVYGIPIELAAMPALAAVAAALGKAWKLNGAVNGRENYGNIYVVAGAPKSTGKGAAAQLAEPILRASEALAEAWSLTERPRLEAEQQQMEARAKYLVNCLAKQKDGRHSLTNIELSFLKDELIALSGKMALNAPLLAAAPSYHVGNATSEALAMKFARNEDTLFALAYEGGDVLRVMLGKYAKGATADCDLWLSGYSVEPHQSDRILRGNVNIVPCLTALIFCQPSLLRELYSNEEAFERGLTARMLPFICEPLLVEDDGTEQNVPESAKEAWDKMIASILELRKTVAVGQEHIAVQCSPEAREVFRQYHNESIQLRNGPLRDIAGELGRSRENACRIALGLCIADDLAAAELTQQQAVRAVTIARWAQFSALRVLRQGRRERRLMQVNKLRELIAEYRGAATFRDLEKSHGFSANEVESLVKEFPAYFEIESRQNPKGGPQSRVLKCPR